RRFTGSPSISQSEICCEGTNSTSSISASLPFLWFVSLMGLTSPKAGAPSTPFIYFDGVMTAGVHQGTVQLELAAATRVPAADTRTTALHVIPGDWRCGPAAAAALRKAIDPALLLLARGEGQSS